MRTNYYSPDESELYMIIYLFRKLTYPFCIILLTVVFEGKIISTTFIFVLIAAVIYGQLPMLDANGVQIGQSGAIMRYIAACTGMQFIVIAISYLHLVTLPGNEIAWAIITPYIYIYISNGCRKERHICGHDAHDFITWTCFKIIWTFLSCSVLHSVNGCFPLELLWLNNAFISQVFTYYSTFLQVLEGRHPAIKLKLTLHTRL